MQESKLQNVVSWFDDRFYRVKTTKKVIDKIQKRVQTICPDYEYTVLDDTIFLPSSTTILGSAPKDWLGRWRGQVGNWEADRIMNEALDKGSRVHLAFSEMLNGSIILLNGHKYPNYTKEQIEAIQAENKKPIVILSDQQEMLEVWRLKQFFDIVKPKVEAMEMSVYSEAYGYAGTLDHLWYIEAGEYDLGGRNNKLTIDKTGFYILDLKTGKEDKHNHPEQLASYMYAVEESDQYKIEGGLILYSNADKKTGIAGFDFEYLSKDDLEYHFKGFVYQLNVWLKKANKTPKVFDLPSLLRMN